MSEQAPAILTRGLTKFYGRERGIEELDLRVERGEAFGFLGPNGAGKTTTINLLMGFRRASRGEAEVLGMPVGPQASELRRRIGFMPGELALYERLRAGEALSFFANLRGGVEPGAVAELAERFGLDLGRRIAGLSRGNKQKVALVAAFMHGPELLILDEPTSGLDPIVQREFQRLVAERTAAGATAFLSSHVLSEVEHICGRVGILREGRLVAVEELRGEHPPLEQIFLADYERAGGEGDAAA